MDWATLGDITSNAGDAKWILLKKDPDKDGFQLVVITSDSRLTTSYWDGGTWASTIDIDTSVDSNLASVADFAWNLTVLWVHWFGILILLG